ncbi:MAG: DNA primase [Candidatus Lokiarchaeota archaeon]|nr:DNA primase [Candidatus Lokiarchaeota archaeon]
MLGAGDFDNSTAKYVIRAKIEIDGVVDKPDVVGAIFGQTEGLLGEDLDLRELQRSGRIGRIQIGIKSEKGKSKGEIVIPVSMDRTATAILAASMETVDRVGPCSAEVTLQKVEDIRGAKRRRVVSRAISILKGWEEEIAPGADEITDAVTKAKKRGITKYGEDKLPAGPSMPDSDEVIIVEGRADVINLMKSGVTNTISAEGTNIPESISELSKKKGKEITAFLDGDRGGDLILRELMQVADIDYIARAPKGKEVEDLDRKAVSRALKRKIPAKQALSLLEKDKKKEEEEEEEEEEKKEISRKKRTPSKKKEKKPSRKKKEERKPRKKRPPERKKERVNKVYVKKAKELKESFKAAVFDRNDDLVKECKAAELTDVLNSLDEAKAIVLDGVVTQRLVDTAKAKGVKIIIAAATAEIESKPRAMKLIMFEKLNL